MPIISWLCCVSSSIYSLFWTTRLVVGVVYSWFQTCARPHDHARQGELPSQHLGVEGGGLHSHHCDHGLWLPAGKHSPRGHRCPWPVYRQVMHVTYYKIWYCFYLGECKFVFDKQSHFVLTSSPIVWSRFTKNHKMSPSDLNCISLSFIAGQFACIIHSHLVLVSVRLLSFAYSCRRSYSLWGPPSLTWDSHVIKSCCYSWYCLCLGISFIWM